jgi:hypothetical protein
VERLAGAIELLDRGGAEDRPRLDVDLGQRNEDVQFL